MGAWYIAGCGGGRGFNKEGVEEEDGTTGGIRMIKNNLCEDAQLIVRRSWTSKGDV
jgi:hypothetical protein